MAAFPGNGLFQRAGHVVAYGITAVAGYFAAGDVLSYFTERAAPNGTSGGNALAGILRLIVQGGFMVVFGLLAAAMVFVAIVGVGGAILSQAWSRLCPMILERVSSRPSSRG